MAEKGKSITLEDNLRVSFARSSAPEMICGLFSHCQVVLELTFPFTFYFYFLRWPTT